MLPYDDSDRDNVRGDLRHADPEVRRLAVERIDALDDAEALEHLVDRLGDPDWRVRKATVQRIAARPDPDETSSKLIAALGDGENPGRRNSAVEALVVIGARAVAPLLAACEDRDADVRKFAVDALAGIGSEAATSALIARLGDADANVRAAAADALGAVGGAAARAALRTAATDSAQDPLVRFSALHALDTLEEPMRVDELASVLGDPILGPAGLALLGRCDGDEMALDALLKGLASGVRAARESSMRGVLRLAARLDDAALADIVRRLDELSQALPGITSSAITRLPEADLGTQLALVQFLGLTRARSAVVPILEVGRDEALAQVALGALAEIGPAAADELDAAWPRLSQDRQRAACDVLGRVGGPRATERLVAALDASDPMLRAAAARALGALRVEKALVPLVRRLECAAPEEDPDGESERAALIDAIVALAGPDGDGRSPAIAPRAVDLLAAALSRSGDETRLAAARALGRIARREDAELVALLMKDPSARVRRAAVDAIARLEPDRTPEPLHLAIADESASVRIAAARALGASRSESVFDDLRRLAEDEDPRVRAMAVLAVGRRFAADREPAVRAAALAVLGRACEDAAPVALAVVEALKEIGGEASGYVIPLLGRPEPEVVREAVRCFGDHGEQGELEALLPLVSHPDWSVRAEVVEILAERGVRQAVPAILRRLETEQDDVVRSVTLAALQRLES
ncbi:MAG TPA: HEAT repeat domain-containing protein [Myxococcota bacterium]|nr:HEAT repeat domain-containing protein [Myxococcota bacterium]